VKLVFNARQRHPVVDLLLRDLESVGPPVDRSIDAGDEMLHFARVIHQGDEDAALTAYFRDGLSVFSAIRQLAAWRPGGLGQLDGMLDFASGYGRVTRFLVRELAPDHLWVSDIQRQAVAFQGTTFGVNGVVATPQPADFDPGRQFDLIFVTSLFTHLPEITFCGWLERLLSLLSPEGPFSVHDESLLPAGSEMPEGGLYFEASSESRRLDPAAYGSTWVSESYVRAAVSRLAPAAACKRLPRALGRFQDVYVVIPNERGVTSQVFDPGPFGFLDRCSCRTVASGRAELELRGWAAQAIDGGEVSYVRVHLGEETTELRELQARPDVQREMPEAGRRTGFMVSLPLPEDARLGSLPLVIEAETTRGIRAAIDAGTVARAQLCTAWAELAATVTARQRETRRLELQIEALTNRIAAMEASRFWKMRSAWFRAKRALGMTSEP
jgi:hypothetical protein